jgi:CRISPR-associated endonuclease/helicase Cas3
VPVRTIHLFNNAVNFLVEQCGASVVLCTATQPLLHKVDATKGAMRLLADSELMPDAPQLFRDLKRHETLDESHRPGGWQNSEVADLAVAETLKHGSCLVVVNTKRDALAIYKACKGKLAKLGETLNEDWLVYLSTHMCPAHRLQALGAMKRALSENRRVLCVSTQLIEAGVDIDFATVVRDLAGLDSIAQAAGRCNRNGKRRSGCVHIVKLATPLPKALEEIRCAQGNAARVLNDWKDATDGAPFDLSDPEQMRTFFTYHFFARSNLMTYPVKTDRDDTLLCMLGSNSMATADTRPPSERVGGMMQSFLSAARAFRAIDSVTQGVIVPFGDAGSDLIAKLSATHDLPSQFRLLRQAQHYTVNLFQHEISALDGNGAIVEAQPGTGVRCLRPGFYSDEYGLDLDGNVRMESIIA